MNAVYVYVYLLFIHFIADFVCQSDWIAQNKSRNIDALINHIAIYFTVLLLMTVGDNILWVFINSFAHFAIDFVTSKINARLWREKKVHQFFVSIGFDQFLHTALLLLTWRLTCTPG